MECSFCLAALYAQKAAKTLLRKNIVKGAAWILLFLRIMLSDGRKSNNRNYVFSDLTLKPWASGIPLLVSLLVILLKICLLFSPKRSEKSRALCGIKAVRKTSLCLNRHMVGL